MKKWKSCLNRNSTIIVLFILLLGFSGCDLFFVDTSIRPEKPPLFRMGDTLIFNSAVNVDSFYVERARLYEVNEDDGSGEEWDKERFFSRLIQIDCLDSCYGFKSTIKPQEYYIGVLALGYSSSDSYRNMGMGYSSIKLRGYIGGRELNIGKYDLKDLYECNTILDTLGQQEINSVLYCKKYGVVQYILNNGEVFQIEEECLKMLMARE